MRLLQMLSIDVESSLSPKVAWFQSYLGLSTTDVISVIEADPNVLHLKVENLEDKVRLVVMVVIPFPCLDMGTPTARFMERVSASRTGKARTSRRGTCTRYLLAEGQETLEAIIGVGSKIYGGSSISSISKRI